MIDWSKITRIDLTDVDRIATRAIKATPLHSPMLNKMDLTMDLAAAHIACPIDLQQLLDAKELDFWHDVSGIIKHIDRETGELRDCFVPRCAKREEVAG